MGSRGLIGFIIRGKKRGCFNSHGSTPDDLGMKIVRFIVNLSPVQVQDMKEKVEAIEW